MNVLIVFAHPEPRSFGRALLDRSVTVLQALGHRCTVRDLHAMKFDPVESGDDFTARSDPAVLHYDLEQYAAARTNAFAPALRAEIDLLLEADLVILQFPLYWFSAPAILKGWIDRVFANGIIYGDGRWYDRGALAGKRAMLSITTGCYPPMCEPDGINGNLDVILWPLQNGTLRFVGFDVLPPFIAWSVAHKGDAERAGDFVRYEERLRALDTTPLLPFNARGDFSAGWRLKDGVVPVAVGQRAGASPSKEANPADIRPKVRAAAKA